jgi:hypothetical protein
MAARASSMSAPSIVAGPRSRASPPSSVSSVCEPSGLGAAGVLALADGAGLAPGLWDAPGLALALAGAPAPAEALAEAPVLVEALADALADGSGLGTAAGSPWPSTGWKVS